MDLAKSTFGDSAYALLVGVKDFSEPRYGELPHAVSDVDGIARALNRRLDWKPSNIKALVGTVTKSEIITAFHDIRQQMSRSSLPAKLFLFFLSTHGQLFRDRGKDATVLLAADTDLKDTLSILESGITRDFLSIYVSNVPANQRVVILDACYSGPTVSTAELTSSWEIDAAVLASSVGVAYALPTDTYSVFTSCIVEEIEQSLRPVLVRTLADRVSDCVSRRMALDADRFQATVAETRGGRIVLGYPPENREPVPSVSYSEILEYCTTHCLLLLAQTSRHGYDPAQYVRRRGAEGRFLQFLNEGGEEVAFTLVGSAGSGKTTLMTRLADLANRNGNAVVWLGSTQVERIASASDLLTEGFRELGGVSLSQLRAAFDGHRPVVLFLDAINEWPIASHIATSLCHDLLRLALDTRIRLVVSCREQSWTELGRPFETKMTFSSTVESRTQVISASVEVFNDEEVAELNTLYPLARTLQAGELGRRALFLRMLSEMQVKHSADQDVSFVSIFEEYVEAKIQRIAVRLSNSAQVLNDTVSKLVAVMQDRGVQSLTSEEFLRLASEPVAIALLDENLFRRTGTEVTVEAELVHEFLLSRLLPRDLKIDDLSLAAVNAPLCGAIVFRLCEIEDPQRVSQLLPLLPPERLLQVLPRLPALQNYHSFYLTAFKEMGLFDAKQASGQLELVLERGDDKDYSFCLEALRILFGILGDDEWKRTWWRGLGSKAFDDELRRLEESFAWEAEAALLLSKALRRRPREGLAALLLNWLPDRSRLRVGSLATIRQVATAYACAIGEAYPSELLEAIDRYLHSNGPDMFPIFEIIAAVAGKAPEEFWGYAQKWIRERFLAGFNVIHFLPRVMAPRVVEVVREVVTTPGIPEVIANDAVASLSNLTSPSVLRFVAEASQDSRLAVGVVRALSGLVKDSPASAQLVQAIDISPKIPREVIEAVCEFYGRSEVFPRKPSAAIKVFTRVLNEQPSIFNETIARTFTGAIVHPTRTKFVEWRLGIEERPRELEYYHYYICRARRLNLGDLPWLLRWISSGPVYGLFEGLVASKIPLPRLVDLFVQIEKTGFNYLSSSDRLPYELLPRLKKLALRLTGDPRFQSFDNRRRRWFELVASGVDPSDARRTERDEFLRRVRDERKKRDEPDVGR